MASCWPWFRHTCVCCLSEDEKKSVAIHKKIQKELKKQKKKERKEIKILLLGTGESGKTTFIRQMRIIHGKGFSEEDRKTFAKCIFQNIFTAVKAMTAAMSTLKIPYSNPENEIYAKWMQDINTVQITQLERGYVDAIRRLWADSGIRLCYTRRCEYQLLDSTEYYLSNLDRIASPDYIPTEQDVLRVRFPTTGIHDYSFNLKNITLRIVDVGGQKSERRKWIHCFENVTSLIFLASLSEYDQVLEERETTNRMNESLSLFEIIIHSKWFHSTSIILFLNKTDILADKIKTSDLKKYFSHFNGERGNEEAAQNFIKQMYEDRSLDKTLYQHFTCATDTNNIRKVFADVKDTVLLKSLGDYGIL
ncbi:hypothetical protein WMY93_025302 [Mugilogobius chulae]|uniref:Uncharacterized protein n=1 Tax=Mugilogobius chulae TaxID=88201 RepID=A0AAW0N6F0_9GOBI